MRSGALSAAQLDRACGALVGSAVGDALGAGYEFGSAPYDGTPRMIGGGLGGFAPGEWTDDTAQLVAIARVAAEGVDLRSAAALDAIAGGFAEWYAGNPPDVGVQTAEVLRRAGFGASGERMADAARTVHERTGRSAGNGSLMRSAPVALAYLRRPVAELVEAAMAVSALTHHDPLAGEGAALWCLMIRHAVLHGELPEAAEVLAHLPHADRWAALLLEAETSPPSTFTANGWVVGALQAAWSAITRTPVPRDVPCTHLQHSLATAIGIGHDTDTVAAIAGALLGATWGASALPLEWSHLLHGWGAGPRGARDLVRWASLTVGGRPGEWPDTDHVDYGSAPGAGTIVPHPLVHGLWIGGAEPDPRPTYDAVVSLCRTGRDDWWDEDGSEHADQVEVRLIDTTAEDNPHVDFVVEQAVVRFLDEGRRVYLHCVQAQSRTPVVAARVAVLCGADPDEALEAVLAALPGARPAPFLLEAYRRLPVPLSGPGLDDPHRFLDHDGRIDKKMLHLRGLLSDNNLFGGDDVNPDPLVSAPLRRARGFRMSGDVEGEPYEVGVFWGGELGRRVAIRGWDNHWLLVESLISANKGHHLGDGITGPTFVVDRDDPLAVRETLRQLTRVHDDVGDVPPGGWGPPGVDH